MSDTTLGFSILAHDNASRTVTRIGQSFGNLHASVGKVTKGLAAVAPALAGLAVGAGIKMFIDDARESAKVGRLTAQVIKSTGGAARVTADQVGALATAISNKTGADDEAIQSGQNMLLTFTNIRNGVGKGNDIFNQASQAITDMTAAMNGGEVTAEGMKTSSIQLGKALNDPIKGVTALQKVGVSFTADQKKQIKTLVDSGKTMEAQKIILGELSKEFGGAAAAAADPLTKLKTIAGNLSEQIGGYLLPIVDKFATFLGSTVIPFVSKLSDQIAGKLAPKMKEFGQFIDSTVLPALMRFGKFIADDVLPLVGRILGTFSGLGSKIVKAIGSVDLGGIASDIFTGATKWAGRLIDGLKSGITSGNWKPLGSAIGDGISKGLKALGDSSGAILDGIGALFDKIDWAKIGGKISGAVTGMLKAVNWKQVGSSLGDAVVTIFQKTGDLATKIGTSFKALMTSVDWKTIGHDATDAIGQFVVGVDWGKVVKTLGVALFKSVKLNLNIKNLIINALADVAIGVGESIGGAFKDAGKWLQKAGGDLVSGLMSGIAGKAKELGGWLKAHIVDPVVNGVKNLFGIKSPSTVFASIGRDLIAGLLGGIAGAAKSIAGFMSKNVISPAVALFGKAGSWLVQHGKNMVAGLKNGISAIARTVGGWLRSNVVNPIVGVFTKAGTWLVQHGKNAIAGLKNGVASIARGIGGWVIRTVVNPLVGAFTKAGSWLVAYGRNAVAGFKNGIVAIARGIGGWAGSNVVNPFVGAFTRAGSWLVQHGKNAIAGFKNGISALAGGVGSFAYSRVISPLVAQFGKAGKWLVQAGKNVIAGFKNGMVSVWGSVTTWVSGIATWIKDHKGPVSLDGRLLIPAGKAIMSGFLKGLKSGAGPAWGFVKKVGGKTVDMLRGEMFQVPGVIPGALSGPNRRVFYDGQAFDLVTYNKLVKAMQKAGSIHVTQGGYEHASSYSGTTHTGGGVFDVVGGNLSRILGALKASGLIGWIRNPNQGPWPWHIHALDPSDTARMSSSARAQVASYYRGGNGLGGYAQGTPWIPNDQTAFLHKGEAVIPRAVNEARLAASKSGGTQPVVLEFRSDGSPHMDWLVKEVRKYVRVAGQGDVQKAFGAKR